MNATKMYMYKMTEMHVGSSIHVVYTYPIIQEEVTYCSKKTRGDRGLVVWVVCSSASSI